MRLALAAGVALAGLSLSALAEELPRIDSNNDGWITRAEASAMAERTFRDMDGNNDGKLDAADRREDRPFHRRMHHHGRGDGDEHSEGRHVERDVIVRRDSGVLEREGEPTAAPTPPRPPRPPMFMMLIANNEEADLNGDNALSLEEFRNQNLRFFDASDVNGDGRIQFDPPRMPEPPEAPRPPPTPH